MNEKVTIQELKVKKEKLRQAIKDLVDGFSDETGTAPTFKIEQSVVSALFGSTSYSVRISIKI